MSFHFVNEGGTERTKIMFTKKECIFTLDFTDESIEEIYIFSDPLNNQPGHFQTNDDQTIFSVSNKSQSIVVDKPRKNEMSINKEYELEIF